MSNLPRERTAFAKYFDHTLLRPTATRSEIEALCKEAVEHGFATVCVNGYHLKTAVTQLRQSSVKPIAVIGFPLGAMTSRDKGMETRHLVEEGAQEIDMVLNLGAYLNGERGVAGDDIHTVVGAAGRAPVKVIVETAFLSSEQIADATRLCASTGAAFVKTSTGFGPRGATVEDILIMSRTIAELGEKAHGLKIKASGGIKTLDSALAMIEAGAHRIGSSQSVGLLKEFSQHA